MTSEDAKDLTLSILVVVVAMLLADCIWLHVKCARLSDEAAVLAERVERHINPPAEAEGPSLAERARQTYDKVKNAAVKGYEAAKGELKR